MGSPIVDVGATIMCPHGAPVNTISTNPRVKVGGTPAVTMKCLCMVAGCPFTVPPGIPNPCIKVGWIVPATRVKVMGSPVILKSSTGLTQGLSPPGPPNVVVTQMRVKGT